MQLHMLKSKIHCATVTEANLHYMGSITIDDTLLRATNILPGEQVQVVNNSNGERVVTYVIRGKKDSGCICLNGAAARKFQVGDEVIIMTYAIMNEDEAKNYQPKVIFPDRENKISNNQH